MKKIIFLTLFPLLFLFAQSSLDKALLEFDIDGGREKNPTLYKMIGASESSAAEKEFLKSVILKNKKEYLTAKRVLAQKGVPSAFVWIAMTESKFNSALSCRRGRYVGVWQMAPMASRMFGLTVSKGADERKSVEKSTAAFADYCLYMRKKFRSWGAVAVAYNCGDERFKKIVKKTKTDDLNELFAMGKKGLPKTTSIYFKRTVGFARAAEDPQIKEFLENLENGEEG